MEAKARALIRSTKLVQRLPGANIAPPITSRACSKIGALNNERNGAIPVRRHSEQRPLGVWPLPLSPISCTKIADMHRRLGLVISGALLSKTDHQHINLITRMGALGGIIHPLDDAIEFFCRRPDLLNLAPFATRQCTTSKMVEIGLRSILHIKPLFSGIHGDYSSTLASCANKVQKKICA